MSGIGDKFQQETKYEPSRIPRHKLVWDAKPPLYKEYPEAQKIELVAFDPRRFASLCEAAGTMILDRALRQRKSTRDFQQQPISKDQLSYLLWASTGIQRIEDGYEFRTTPSAGALYPIETYVVINDVRKLEAGVYHYSIKTHLLEQLKQGEFRQEITAAALGQEMCQTSAVVFVWSAVFERCKWKYGQRAYRYIYLDAGHIAENLALAAVSLNLGSCEIGALYDNQVNAILGIDGTEESVVCMAVVGIPA
ncbi:MAG: SagB/ThcOx family dehydrogenase [Planctomycetes bacterium]|nr:SagB/ThcOx family dehydrogenase [Planctomycetota bacterium]MCH8120450.1 SagB/ThcOx family dehydrogenase [Planctomycetota bacterium]